MPARSASWDSSGEAGAFSTSRTVSGSTTSIGWIGLISPRPHAALQREVAGERVLHRLGVELLAVVEGDARAQRDDQVGGVLVAPARGKLRDDVEPGVDVEQLVAHRGIDDAADQRGPERGVEDVGVLAQGDAQRAVLGVRARDQSRGQPGVRTGNGACGAPINSFRPWCGAGRAEMPGASSPCGLIARRIAHAMSRFAFPDRGDYPGRSKPPGSVCLMPLSRLLAALAEGSRRRAVLVLVVAGAARRPVAAGSPSPASASPPIPTAVRRLAALAPARDRASPATSRSSTTCWWR